MRLVSGCIGNRLNLHRKVDGLDVCRCGRKLLSGNLFSSGWLCPSRLEPVLEKFGFKLQEISHSKESDKK